MVSLKITTPISKGWLAIGKENTNKVIMVAMMYWIIISKSSLNRIIALGALDTGFRLFEVLKLIIIFGLQDQCFI